MNIKHMLRLPLLQLLPLLPLLQPLPLLPLPPLPLLLWRLVKQSTRRCPVPS